MADTLTIDTSRPVNEFAAPQFMLPDEILWPLPPDKLILGTTDVHVWAAHLDLPSDARQRLAALLSKDEQERAARFRLETHRNRFIAGRGILRSLLAKYLLCAPSLLRFAYSPQGKPSLAEQFAESGLSFNLAHSSEIALIAMSRLGPIGVDVEHIRPIEDADELVQRFFSARENALFQALPASQKDIAFYNLWTRKEAWLKGTGEGIAHSLSRVEVTFLPGEPAKLLTVPDNSQSREGWVLHELLPAAGFVGALAISRSRSSICTFRFNRSEPL
jgi:4'-phosphopantetheinyl transferase